LKQHDEVMTMNAPAFPANPAFGQYYGNWVWSGSRWVCTNTSGIRVVVQVFRASAPYTPSPGLVSLTVECVGAGGVGGDVAGDSTVVAGGGGGGSGGYSRVTLPAALVLGGVNVTIGQTGAIAYPPPNDRDYEAGGSPTSFGSFCLANGGQGGGGNAAVGGLWGFPGLGAPVGLGDIALPGNPGTPGTSQSGPASINVVGGGGGAIWGGGGTPNLIGVGGPILAGIPATGPGGGGGGAAFNQNATGGEMNGGAGGNGICVVTEYCWADAIDDGCGCGPTGQARIAAPGWQGGYGYDND
jgi:hypothetical protein